MNTYFALVVLPNLSVASVLFVISIAVSVIIHAMIALDSCGDEANKLWRRVRQHLYAGLFIILANVFIPSESQLTKVYAIDIIKETEGVDKLPKNIVARLNKLLEVSEDE